jgi:hypothetical protein
VNLELKKTEEDISHTKLICEYEDGGWCESPKRCKDKSRVYKEGPRGGKQRSDSFCCMKAMYFD